MNSRGSGNGWERLFWLVFQRSSNGIVLLDEHSRIVEVNDGGVVVFGRSRAQLIGTSVAALIRPHERANAAKSWLVLVRTGEFVARRTFVRPDGSEIRGECAARLAIVGGRRLAICVLLGRNGPSPDMARRSRASGALTQREREVVTLIALGLESPQIAEELYISEQTVRTHVRNAMSKLGARTRAQLVAIALATANLKLPDMGE